MKEQPVPASSSLWRGLNDLVPEGQSIELVIEEPVLVNAAAMAKSHLANFRLPSPAELDRIQPTSFVMVCIPRRSDAQFGMPSAGEHFWVEVMLTGPNGLLIGRVDSVLDPACHLKMDNVIGFHRDNVYVVR